MTFSHRPKKTRTPALASLALCVGLALCFVVGLSTWAKASGAEVPAREETAGTALYMVQVQGLPSAWSSIRALEAGAAPRVAGDRARSQAARNEQVQADVATAIEQRDLAEEEVFRVATAFNGVAVLASQADARRIESIDGVRSVTRLPLVRPANSHSVPYIGGDDLWSLPAGSLTGQGISIGVIDTGIDYVHRTFGGSGTVPDLTAARSAAQNPLDSDLNPSGFSVTNGGTLYPSAKVVGGFDFAGDEYNAEDDDTDTPRPDPNPMDCPTGDAGGHGTHVAGTAGGYGVTSGGDTFTGSYDGLDPTGMKIGPGVAPEAELWALRVFGCSGSSGLTVQALDWALDPNRDGNPADRLDVLNLSLGSDYGQPDTPDAKAATAASRAGTIVVIAAGNGGNQIYQAGSPASSPQAITVANMVSSRLFDGIRVTGAGNPANNGVKGGSASIAYDWEGMAAPVAGQLHYPASNRTGCDPFSPAEAAAMGGKVALLDWRSVRDDPNSSFPCGSKIRVDNAEAAGAIGVVIADSATVSTTAISGNALIPAIYVTHPLNDRLRDEAGTAEVSFEKELIGAIRNDDQRDTVADSSSRGPGASGVLKPDVSAPGADITSAAAGSGNGSEALTGTSMASPHVAGLMALLREQYPSWTVEELKALVMNTATDNLLKDLGTSPPGVPEPPQRVGTGTVSGEAAVAAGTIAYAADGDGAVGISFGPVQVPPGGPLVREDEIRVVNRENVFKDDVQVEFVPRSSVPGAVWSLPDGATVDLPADGSVDITVRLTVADPSALRNSRDATLLSGSNREWIAETSGLVKLTDGGGRGTSVPVYASLAPVSTLSATQDSLTLPAGATSGNLEIQGQAVFTGNTVDDFVSLLTPLELQFQSPRKALGPSDPPSYAQADLRDVGVSYEPASDTVTFGISFWADAPNPSSFAFRDVYVDSNRDGTDDYLLYTGRAPSVEEGDSFGTVVRQLPGGPATFVQITPVTSFAPSGRAFDSDVITMTVPRTAIGLTPEQSRFDYVVEGSNASSGTVVEESPSLTFDYLNPGVSFLDPSLPSPRTSIRADVPGDLGFTFDAAAMEANDSIGALLIHHMNASGERSEAIPVTEDNPVEVSVAGPTSLPEGSPASFTAQATGPGGPFTFDWALGEGDFDRSGNPLNFTADDGPALIVVKARATGSAAAAFRNRDLTVTNVAPAVRMRNTGKQLRRPFVLISAGDPSGADRAAGFTFRIDFRADGKVDRVRSGKRVKVRWPAGRRVLKVRVTATDKDGGVSRPASIKRPRKTGRVR